MPEIYISTLLESVRSVARFFFDINHLQNRKSQIFRELNTRCKARNIRGVFEGRVYLSCHVYYSFIVLKYCPLVK